MKPFLRPTDRAPLAPVGWAAEPAGQWGGREMEIVYDPRRHQVLLVRTQLPDSTHRALAGAGYERMTVNGSQEVWVRDRLAAVRVGLERCDRTGRRQRSVEVGGLDL